MSNFKYCRTSLSYVAACFILYHPEGHDRDTLRRAARVVLDDANADPQDCLRAHQYR